MDRFSTKLLFNVLITLIELQIIATRLKYQSYYTISKTDYLPVSWGSRVGICSNVTEMISYNKREWCNHRLCLYRLFRLCPSYSGLPSYPVRSDRPVTSYHSATGTQMWGDDKYADNRRQILKECIQLLQTELLKRGYNNLI